MSSETNEISDPIVKIENLSKAFQVKKSAFGGRSQTLKAVSNVDLSINQGECLGLVGESGCGKSTLGRLILKLLVPSEGRIVYDGVDMTAASKAQLHDIRRHIQVVFQDPYSSLNPRMKIGKIIAEPLRNLKMNEHEITRRVNEVLVDVGLAQDFIHRYPHEFSGGQRQRICIARALAQRPRLLICDEAVSALDVSIQAQILNLLATIKSDYNLTILFISHSLGVIRHIADRVAVMYLGQIVEVGSNDDLFTDALHPYTKCLISAVLEPSRRQSNNRILLKGEIPSPLSPPSGCYFSTRCPIVDDHCRKVMPPLVKKEDGREVRCHKPGEFSLGNQQ
ncbi:MAG: ATP-binding cassette domain-containing protein [Rhizobiaceae bacterium]